MSPNFDKQLPTNVTYKPEPRILQLRNLHWLVTVKSEKTQHSQAPEVLQFQKSYSSRSTTVPEVLQFQKYYSSRSLTVPEVLQFQKYYSSSIITVLEVLQFQKYCGSRSITVPEVLQFPTHENAAYLFETHQLLYDGPESTACIPVHQYSLDITGTEISEHISVCP